MGCFKRERSFVSYRLFHELITDPIDAIYRLLTGRSNWPPYSLRVLSGSKTGFDTVGPWFLNEFQRLGLFRADCRILDVGCGCGRLSGVFAKSPELRKLNVRYTGMDIDFKSVAWCRKKITSQNPNFSFYHADLWNKTYNPTGRQTAKNFRFPHADQSFDLIILTSIFTHLLESELRHYLEELFRLLDRVGSVYASFFTYRSQQEATAGTGRHPVRFPHYHGHFAVASEMYPEKAVAYQESFLMELVHDAGFRLRSPVMYGTQDVLLLSKQVG
jgi:SAM-dependent methyltransferase